MLAYRLPLLYLSIDRKKRFEVLPPYPVTSQQIQMSVQNNIAYIYVLQQTYQKETLMRRPFGIKNNSRKVHGNEYKTPKLQRKQRELRKSNRA